MDRARTKPVAPLASLARNLPLGDLLAFGNQLPSDITPERLLQDVAEAITRTLGFPRVYIRLRNADTDALEACAFAGIADDEIARMRSRPMPPAEYQAVLHQSTRISESYLLAEPAPTNGAGRRRIRPEQTRVLLVPLRSHSDRLVGAIYVDLSSGSEVTDSPGIRVLEAIARQAALSLENARLAARMQRLLSKEQLLTELGREVSATLNLDQILQATAERLGRAFASSAILLSNECQQLERKVAVGQPGELRIHCSVGQYAVSQGVPCLTGDLANDQRFEGLAPGDGGSGIATPLRSGGRLIGALTVISDHMNAFTYEDVDLLEAVAAQVGGSIGSAQLYHQAESLAEQVRRRNEHLLVINALANMAVSTLDLPRMLSAVTDQIRNSFRFSHVELYEVDLANQDLVLVANSSMYDESLPTYRQPLATGILGRAFQTGRTIRIDDVALEPSFKRNTALETSSELCVPVVASGRVLALLNVESQRLQAFSDADVEALETVADVLANAIENARLSRRAQEVAVLEERSRLARDLHDSISQQLFSMTLTAQAARAQLDKNPLRTAEQLERLQETAAAALAEMRALIFQLRPPALTEQGLIAALHQLVSSLSHRDGLVASLSVEGDERHARGIEQALYRIAQEALNNVIKHAGDCQVDVQLQLEPHQTTLRIRDNGLGFEPDLIHDRRFGLVSMRERALELGGQFELTSIHGSGTSIVVVVPRKG